MQGYDLLIRNGTIIDGTGGGRYEADIAIRDGRIAVIGRKIPGTATHTLDATGKIVAPGVIDPHTHYDAQINWDPYCTNSGWHGNTTFIVGNCGFGFMPCRAADRERYMRMMENTEQIPVGAMKKALPWTWETFPEWMSHMKSIPKGVNIGAFMPINSLMIYVMGYEAAKSRRATTAEKTEMKRLFIEALDHGAVGFGLSHLNEFNSHKDCDGSPMPSDSMHVEDIYPLAEVLRERGRGAIQFLAELPVFVSNREHVEALARISGRPVLHNVITPFDFLPEYHRGILKWLEECQGRGLQIYSQALCMRAWNESIVSDYNAWQGFEPFFEFTNAGDQSAKAKLAADPDFRERARKSYDPIAMGTGGGSVESFILLTAPGAPEWEPYCGQTFSQIAAERDAAAIDCFLDVIAATGARMEFRTTEATSRDPQKIWEVLSHPYTLCGTSDGGAHIKFFSGGQFATDNIMQMVRETGRMTLEQIHHKLSALPAKVFGFEGRGTLELGSWADLYIYDFDKLGYDASKFEIVHDLPDGDWRRVVRAQGISWIVVNGEITFVDGEATGAVPGRVITNGGPVSERALAPQVLVAAK